MSAMMPSLSSSAVFLNLALKMACKKKPALVVGANLLNKAIDFLSLDSYPSNSMDCSSKYVKPASTSLK